jgi:dihydrosphingosine 1-phosphate phosphatase
MPHRSQGAAALTPAPDSEAITESTAVEPKSYMDAGHNVRHTSSLQVNTPDAALLTPPASDAGASSDSGKEDERNDREMFSALEKPRIRYDVEVITKLVVYAGIAWWAIEGNPLWFRAVGIV